jgi:hypothetical protein
MGKLWPSMIKADVIQYRGSKEKIGYDVLPEEIRAYIILVAAEVDESIQNATNSKGDEAIRILCKSMKTIVNYMNTLNRLSKSQKLNEQSKQFLKKKLMSIVEKIRTYIRSSEWLTEGLTEDISKTLEMCENIDSLIKELAPPPFRRQYAFSGKYM